MPTAPDRLSPTSARRPGLSLWRELVARQRDSRPPAAVVPRRLLGDFSQRPTDGARPLPKPTLPRLTNRQRPSQVRRREASARLDRPYFFSSVSTFPRELPTFLTASRTSPRDVPVLLASYAVSCFWAPATFARSWARPLLLCSAISAPRCQRAGRGKQNAQDPAPLLVFLAFEAACGIVFGLTAAG